MNENLVVCGDETLRVPQLSIAHPPESFEPFDRDDPRLPAFLEPTKRDGVTTHVQMRHYEVTKYGNDGEVAGDKTIKSVAYTEQQDTLDLLPYFECDGKFYVGIYQANRPVVARRNSSSPGSENAESGLVWNLPGKFIRYDEGHPSYDDTADAALAEKVGVSRAMIVDELGVVKKAPLEFLGGAYFSSVSGHTELCFPRAVRVEAPPQMQRVGYGSAFHQAVPARFLELQHVIDGYFAGEFRDVRLVEAVFRFARYKGIDIKIPLEPSSFSAGMNITGLSERVTGSDELRHPAENHERAFSVRELTKREVAALPEVFAHTSCLTVNSKNSAGSPLAAYDAETIERKSINCVDVGCYFWHGGDIYMVLRRGLRVPAGVRNESVHPIGYDTNLRHIDGVYGYLLAGERSAQQRMQAASSVAAFKGGLEKLSAPQPLGCGFTSPAFDPELAYQFLVEVNPKQGAQRSNGDGDEVLFVSLRDILSLTDQGVIKDARLTLLAHTLWNAFKDRLPDYGSFTVDAEKEAFLQLVNSPSRVQSWRAQSAREEDIILSRHPEHRKLGNYVENECGFAPLPQESRDGKWLDKFRAVFGFFPYKADEKSGKVIFSFDHDAIHEVMGDLSPLSLGADGKLLRDAQGHSVTCEWEAYRRAIAYTECLAVWYSDVVLPSKFGIAETETLTWRGKIARMFKEMGMDLDEAREAILSIELEGIIPDKMLRSPQYDEFRDVIVGKLLRFHVLDNLQTRIIYDNWIKHPRVAETALRFYKPQTDPQAYVAGALDAIREVGAYSEGLNRFQAEVSYAANIELRPLALKLAYLIQELERGEKPGSNVLLNVAERHLSKLFAANDELSRCAAEIHTTEPSPENLAYFAALNKIKSGVLREAGSFVEDLAVNGDMFSTEVAEQLRSSRLPAFDDLTVHDSDGVDEQLFILEAVNFDRVHLGRR